MIDPRWQSLDTGGRVHTAQYSFPGGVSRSVLLRVREQQWLIYSPGRSLVEIGSEVIGADADVVLVAPSAGHAMGLDAWTKRFPRARVFSSPAAMPRLRRVTSVPSIAPPTELEALLPGDLSLHVPPGSRTGELWLSVDLDQRRYWLVCDSFLNLAALADGFWLRLAQRLYGLHAGLDVGRIFRWGIKDKAAFREWVIQRFSDERHHVLVPCHGEIDDDPGLADRMIALTRERF